MLEGKLILDKTSAHRLFFISPHIPEIPKQDIYKIDYIKNSYGYRSEEFSDKNNEKKVLFLGCSHTYGSGLPQKDIFADIVSKKLNLDLVNLGQHGDSAVGQIRKAFWYFRNFGHPKVIIATFPLFRIDFSFVINKNESAGFTKAPINKKQEINYTNRIAKVLPQRFEKYSKAPHLMETILTPEFAIMYTYMLIDILDQYCRSHNIKLFWSFWENQEDLLVYTNDIDFPAKESFYTLESFTWMDWDYENNCPANHKFSNCHEELKKDPLFYRAADRQPNGGSHWGLHKHLHIAEDMYNYVSKELNYEN